MRTRYFRQLPGPKIPLETNESLLGYLFRIATRHGYQRLKRLFQAAGYERVHLRFHQRDIRPLAYMLRQHYGDLLVRNYNPPNGTWRLAAWFRGHKLPPWQINQHHPKICVSCLREGGVILDLWDLTFYVCCLKHNEYLTGSCPACKKRLKWTRPKILQCHCGFQLETVRQEVADESTLSLVSAMVDSFSHNEVHGSDCYPDELINVKPHDLIRLVCLVGFSATGRHGEDSKQVKGYELEDITEMLMQAHNVFLDWPVNFQKFLERIKGKQVVISPGSFKIEMFGSFFTRLAYTPHSNLGFVLDEISRYEEKHLAKRDVVVPAESVRTTELKYVKEQLKLSPEAILKSARAGGLVFERQRRYRRPSRVAVESSSLKKFKRRQANRISYSQAMKYLGLNQKPLDSLLSCNVLTKDFHTVLDGRANYSLIKKECEKLLEDINRQARAVKLLPEKSKRISFTRLLATYSSKDLPSKLFLDLIVDGELAVYCSKKKGTFRDFLFNTDDVRAFVVDYLRGMESDLMTYADVEREFGWHECTVLQLIRNGFIKSEERKIGGRSFKFISKESLENWSVDYVTLDEIHDSSGVYYSVQDLIGIGAEPVLKPHMGYGSHWFRHKDVFVGF